MHPNTYTIVLSGARTIYRFGSTFRLAHLVLFCSKNKTKRLWCCLMLYEKAMRCCARWRTEMFVLLVFAALSLCSLKIVFYNARFGGTVALTSSSCIPVRPQPFLACAESHAGVSPPQWNPIGIYIYILRPTASRNITLQAHVLWRGKLDMLPLILLKEMETDWRTYA